MAATSYGLATGTYQAQPDFVANRSQNGGWSARQTYVINASDLNNTFLTANFAKGTRASDLDSNLGAFGNQLYLENVTVMRVAGGYVRLSCLFAGYTEFASDPNDPQDTTPTYVLRGSLTEAPIMEHPEIVALAKSDRDRLLEIYHRDARWDSSNKKLVYPIDHPLSPLADYPVQPTSAAYDFCNAVATGVQTFLRPVFTWTATEEREQAIRNAELNNLGKVDTPDGSPPAAGGTRDWLLTDIDQEQAGELYRTRKSWLLSERGGWDATLYDY